MDTFAADSDTRNASISFSITACCFQCQFDSRGKDWAKEERTESHFVFVSQICFGELFIISSHNFCTSCNLKILPFPWVLLIRLLLQISNKGKEAARFAQLWNKIITSFREEDLISNRYLECFSVVILYLVLLKPIGFFDSIFFVLDVCSYFNSVCSSVLTLF